MSIPFDLWGQRGWPSMDVVGESHYALSIRSLFDGDLKGDGAEITTTVRLVPDPRNKFDRNAVGVWAGPRQIGHLPRDEAARYAPILAALIAQGWSPQVSARIWAADWSAGYGDRDNFTSSVRLQLAEPHLLVPMNPPPAQTHEVLPVGGAIQVTGEEKHLDALLPWLRPEGECWVHATLHEMTEQLARTSRTVVEVRIDGARVGQLTPRMSGELLPAIRHLGEAGLTTGARAIVKGNRIKAEVVLYVPRAHELPESWLTSVAPDPIEPPSRASAAVVVAQPGPAAARPPAAAPPATVPASFAPPAAAPASFASPAGAPAAAVEHGPIPPPPTGIRFVVPPEWPQPPEGWTPPPGWRPDPSWPAAPYGWHWWTPVWS
jgi:hypothetical protein